MDPPRCATRRTAQSPSAGRVGTSGPGCETRGREIRDWRHHSRVERNRDHSRVPFRDTSSLTRNRSTGVPGGAAPVVRVSSPSAPKRRRREGKRAPRKRDETPALRGGGAAGHPPGRGRGEGRHSPAAETWALGVPPTGTSGLLVCCLAPKPPPERERKADASTANGWRLSRHRSQSVELVWRFPARAMGAAHSEVRSLPPTLAPLWGVGGPFVGGFLAER